MNEHTRHLGTGGNEAFSGCLTDEQIVCLLEGRIDASEHEAVLNHIQQCSVCLATVGAATALDDRPTPTDEVAGWIERVAISQPGSRWAGRYEIRERIGAGGMGVVHRAWDHTMERDVALKVLHADADHLERQERRLERESKLMARAKHPNVVTVYDVGRSRGQVYMVMDYVAGMNLRAWLKSDGRRSWRDIVPRLVEAGRGLMAAHRAGMVHLDFKPDNVLIDEHGRALVTDFGLALVRSAAPRPPPNSISTPSSSSRAQTNSTNGTSRQAAGTPAYSPPEQRLGSRSRRVDIFAFCVTTWEALFGRRPFPDDEPRRTQAIRRGLLSVPAGRKIPRPLEHALRSGLAADPGRRPDSMEPLLRALEASVSARWRSRAAMSMAVVTVGALGLVVSTPPEPPVAATASCDAPVDELAAQWSSGILMQIERALPDDGADAALAWAQAKPLVEARRAALDAEFVDVCRAEQRAELGFEAAQEQRLCLLGQRERFRLLLEHVASGDLTAMPLLLGSLPPSPCSDGPTVESRVPLSFEQERELLLSLTRLETEVKLEIGSPAEARALIARAEVLGAHAYRAHAMLQLAMRAQEPAEEVSLLRETLTLAEELDDPMLVARVASMLSVSLETDEAAELVARARDAVNAMTRPRLRAQTDIIVNIVEAVHANAEDRLDAALRHADRALAGARRHDPSTTRVALTLRAEIASRMGRLDDALESQRALLQWSSRHMTSNLELTAALFSIAATQRWLGKLPDARASIERALLLSRQHAEENGPYRELTWSEAVAVAVAQGDLEWAESLSRQVPSALLSADGLYSQELHESHAELLLAQERYRALLDGLRRVRAEASTEDPYGQAVLSMVEAEALRRMHRPRAALEIAERVHPEMVRAAANDPRTARAACTLAWLLIDNNQLERARGLFDEAASRLPSPAGRSWAEFGRAVAQPEGSRAAAESAARAARAQLELYAASHRYELRQLDAWLASPS